MINLVAIFMHPIIGDQKNEIKHIFGENGNRRHNNIYINSIISISELRTRSHVSSSSFDSEPIVQKSSTQVDLDSNMITYENLLDLNSTDVL